MYLHKTITSVN